MSKISTLEPLSNAIAAFAQEKSKTRESFLAPNQHSAVAVGDLPDGECTYCHKVKPLGSVGDVDFRFYVICGECSDLMWQ